MQLNEAFYSLLSFPWLHIFLLRYFFFPFFPLCLFYLWMLCLMIIFMVILVLLLVVHDSLYVPVLACTILVGKPMKYLVSSPRPWKTCMESTDCYSKICSLGVTISPVLWQVYMEAKQNIMSLWYSYRLGQLYVSMIRHHTSEGEYFHVSFISIWHFHQWYILYCNLSSK